MTKISFCNKLFLILIAGFLVAGTVQAQNSFYGKIYYGISDPMLNYGDDLLGSASWEINNFEEFGVQVGKEFNSKWALETGLNFASAQIYARPLQFPAQTLGYATNYRSLSLPALLRYSVFPFLYVNAGPIANIQTSENRLINQTGIGYLVGLGLQHYFNKIGIFVHPHFKQNGAVSFESRNQNISEFGVQFGMGYKF